MLPKQYIGEHLLKETPITEKKKGFKSVTSASKIID